jgi:hypothetical protein
MPGTLSAESGICLMRGMILQFSGLCSAWIRPGLLIATLEVRLVFIDESGHSKGPKQEQEQPFYVLAAFIVEAHAYIAAAAPLRDSVKSLYPDLSSPIGQGSEIKARQIANIIGIWKHKLTQGHKIRDLMLGFPSTCDGKVCVCVIDKNRYNHKYRTPTPPYELTLTYTLERVQRYLDEVSDHGLCVYDQAKSLDDQLHRHSVRLIRDGSYVEGPQGKAINLERIIEFYLGSSENSLGLQVADFFATYVYQFFKRGMPLGCDWWPTLCSQLYAPGGRIIGSGLKLVPPPQLSRYI